MTGLFEPLSFDRGPPMPNRLMLAPLTNTQSHPDGTVSEQELDWLAMRARGGFGLVMTAAAFVQPEGIGFPGQLGIHDDSCLPGLTRVADAIRAQDTLTSVQLHHAGMRAPAALTDLVLAPSDDPASGARAMTLSEVEAMIESFIAAARRAEIAGFDGVELHGAHTYLLCAFLSAQYNRRTDRYGGSLDNRAAPIRRIIAGIRARCRPSFQVGLRLSAERMGMQLGEVRTLCQALMREGGLDYIDLSLWDVFKTPEEADFRDRPLISWFTDLDRGATRLGVAGNIRSATAARACLEAGADFVLIGRAAIAHHDFPRRIRDDAEYRMPDLPLSRAHLREEGISPPFIDYLARSFPNFVAAE